MVSTNVVTTHLDGGLESTACAHIKHKIRLNKGRKREHTTTANIYLDVCVCWDPRCLTLTYPASPSMPYLLSISHSQLVRSITGRALFQLVGYSQHKLLICSPPSYSAFLPCPRERELDIRPGESVVIYISPSLS